MTNLKHKQFFNAITGDNEDEKQYGINAEVYRKSDNVDILYDSRGEYLGLRMSMGKIVNGKWEWSKGPYYYESFDDLKIWAGAKCSNFQTKDNKLIVTG